MVPAVAEPLTAPGVRHLTGTVAELHGLDPFADGPLRAPEVWWCDFRDAAIVLGSRQTPDVLDVGAVTAAGLAVVRRRSGGGAVLMRPGAVVWIDLVVPAATPGWPDDVRASMIAAGELWQAALGGAPPRAHVHTGGMVESGWAQLVCFAGLGPGELVEDAPGGAPRKLVGLSQRRTRHGARIQGLVHARGLVRETADYLAPLMAPDAAPPTEAAARSVAPERLAMRLAEALRRPATDTA